VRVSGIRLPSRLRTRNSSNDGCIAMRSEHTERARRSHMETARTPAYPWRCRGPSKVLCVRRKVVDGDAGCTA
jgi:hypothetical protein